MPAKAALNRRRSLKTMTQRELTFVSNLPPWVRWSRSLPVKHSIRIHIALECLSPYSGDSLSHAECSMHCISLLPGACMLSCASLRTNPKHRISQTKPVALRKGDKGIPPSDFERAKIPTKPTHRVFCLTGQETSPFHILDILTSNHGAHNAC